MKYVVPTLVAALVIILFFLLEKQVFRIIKKNTSSLKIQMIRWLINIVVLSVICYFYLNHFAFTRKLSGTLLQSSSLILAIATFSCQQVLGNVISGFMLSTTKPFDIGDKITLLSTGGRVLIEGIVLDMNARHVKFQKMDGKVDFVTNYVVDSCIVENSNVADDNGRIFVLECSYDSDVELAIQIVKQAIEAHPLTIQKNSPAAKVLCSNLNPSGFELKTTIWANNISDSFQACSDLRIQIAKLWKENGIEIPYQTITLDGKIGINK